jgi:hypothetical protein
LVGTLKNNGGRIEKFITGKRNWLITLCIFLILLTFTRKDLLFSILISYIIYLKISSGWKKRALHLLFILVIGALPIISTLFFSDINKKTFSEDQIRLTILLSGIDIIKHYAPLGSGPGTFGSIMSVKYTKVYKKFGVPKQVYEGWGEKERGPIFDVFIISLVVEYGAGVLFFFIFYLLMYRCRAPEILMESTDTRTLKKTVFIYIILASLTVPVLNNSTGMMLFALVGIFSESMKRSGPLLSTSPYRGFETKILQT